MRLTDVDGARLEVESGISREVHEEAGCFTALTEDDLIAAGFPRGQVIAPALIFPVRNWTGDIHHHIARPHVARIRDGKRIKYEAPKGSGLCIDVHPRVGPQIDDPSITLYVTEGPRKSMAAISRGLCAVSIQGVWCWQADGKPLEDWKHIRLERRVVRLVFDSDYRTNPSVAAALGALQSFLIDREAIVQWVDLPPGPNGEKVGWDDWFVQGHTVEDIEGIVRSALPQIVVTNRPLRDITSEAITSLVRVNDPPSLYVQGKNIVWVRTQEGRPVVTIVDSDTLRHRLVRAANFIAITKKGFVHVIPEKNLLADVEIEAVASGAFPTLDSISMVPFLRQDGTICDEPGYDAASRILYVPPSAYAPVRLGRSPSPSDTQWAIMVIADVLHEFPFKDDASRAGMLALLLTPVVRPMIAWCTPLALLDKPSPGTGASLLADVVGIVATGRPAPMSKYPRDETEMQKRITALMAEGATLIVWDNVDVPVESGALSSALTSPIHKDRILGVTKNLEVPQRATWSLTGNNIQIRGDIARRSYWIRLDAGVSRPWERSGFRHEDLRAFVSQERTTILAALLVLARAWVLAGKPEPDVRPMGSFEEWSRIVGGILQHAGIAGFLGNLDELYEQIDIGAGQFEAFIAAVADEMQDRVFTTSDLVKRIGESQALRDAVPEEVKRDKDGRVSPDSLGKYLRRKVDVVVRDGERSLRLAKGRDSHHKTNRWRVFTVLGGTFSSPHPRATRERARQDTSNEERRPEVPQTTATTAQDLSAPRLDGIILSLEEYSGPATPPQTEEERDGGMRVALRRIAESWGWPVIYIGYGEYVGLRDEQEESAPVWRGGGNETTPSGRQAEWDLFSAGADDDHIRWAIEDLQSLEA